MRKKLSHWKSKFLTHSGRLVLAKSTLNAIPAYIMQYFNLPTTICKAIDKIQRDFIWGSTSKKKKLHLLSWDKVPTSKQEGGLGVLDARTKSSSLLTSLAWRAFSNTQTLWDTTLIKKYNKRRTYSAYSFIWKNILAEGTNCAPRIAWIPGSGTTISVWYDRWIPKSLSLCSLIQGPLTQYETTLKLSQLWASNQWDWTKLSFTLPPRCLLLLLCLLSNPLLIYLMSPTGPPIRMAYFLLKVLFPSLNHLLLHHTSFSGFGTSILSIKSSFFFGFARTIAYPPCNTSTSYK